MTAPNNVTLANSFGTIACFSLITHYYTSFYDQKFLFCQLEAILGNKSALYNMNNAVLVWKSTFCKSRHSCPSMTV